MFIACKKKMPSTKTHTERFTSHGISSPNLSCISQRNSTRAACCKMTHRVTGGNGIFSDAVQPHGERRAVASIQNVQEKASVRMPEHCSHRTPRGHGATKPAWQHDSDIARGMAIGHPSSHPNCTNGKQTLIKKIAGHRIIATGWRPGRMHKTRDKRQNRREQRKQDGIFKASVFNLLQCPGPNGNTRQKMIRKHF